MESSDFAATALLELTQRGEAVVGRLQFTLPYPVSTELTEICRELAGVEDAYAEGCILTLTAQACPDIALAKAVLAEVVSCVKSATGYKITVVGVQRVDGQPLGPASLPASVRIGKTLLGRFCRSWGWRLDRGR